MLVSVIIGLLNEEKYLPKLIDDFKNQTYDKKKIELIFIDGMSTDKSYEILTNFKNENKDFYNIILLKNSKKILSVAMNLGIKRGSGDCFLKVDCHSHIPENFIENNVNVIRSGEYICGGSRPNIIENKTPYSNILLKVEENIFGSGIAGYRRKIDRKYVSSVFQGMYKREVFEKCGLLDELVGRVEDNELHYRFIENGYKIRYSGEIISYQYTRPTYKKMLKQKYSNGYWIGKVSHIYPKCFSLFHFVPFLFVILIFLMILFCSISFLPFMMFLGLYFLFLFFITFLTVIKDKFSLLYLLMPFLIFGIHISYGVGTFVGFLKGFSWKKFYYKNKNIEFI